MKRLFLMTLSVFICAQAALANSLTDARILKLENYLQDNDPMPSTGNFAGQMVENDIRRTLILLDNSEKQLYGIDQSDIAFANFRHNGEFYIATMPALNVNPTNDLESATKVVKNAMFVKKHWAEKVRPETATLEIHSEIVFELEDSAKVVLVYNQDKKESLAEKIKLNGLVLSIEAIRSEDKKDENFLPTGLSNSFAIGYRVYSLEERANNYKKEVEAEVTKHDIDFSDTYSFHATAKSQDYLLFKAIEASDMYGRDQTYNLLTNNCTNRLFDLIDTTMGYNVSKGYSVDYSAIQKSYTTWINNDLDGIVAFLNEYSKSNPAIQIPLAAKVMLQSNAKGLALKSIKDLEMQQNAQENPKNFLYNLPSFIDGHLEARGLLK